MTISPQLSEALDRLGWGELSSGNDDILPFLGVAALELGRRAASPHGIVQLLGGSPLVQALAMYGEPGAQVSMTCADGLLLATIVESVPVTFTDSLGVHHVSRLEEAPAAEGDGGKRQAAWGAAVVGYFAGLASYVVESATEHARERRTFGRTLAHLDAVQQRLADAATITDSLVLSARAGSHGLPAVAHAASSTWEVMLNGHMLFGALGFTLEFPMQRYSRRAKAFGAFVDGWIDQCVDKAARVSSSEASVPGPRPPDTPGCGPLPMWGPVDR